MLHTEMYRGGQYLLLKSKAGSGTRNLEHRDVVEERIKYVCELKFGQKGASFAQK